MSRKHFKRFFGRQYEKTGLKRYCNLTKLDLFVYELSGCGFESHWSHLNGYAYHFSVDYVIAADILDIHKCLMKKNGIV